MTRQRTALSRSDEWETPQDVYDQLCYAYGINPHLDVAATEQNRKCPAFYSEENFNALETDWHLFKRIDVRISHYVDVWCNPPHSKTKDFVLKAHEQWKKHNINIMMLVPAGVLCRKYFEEIFEKFVLTNHGVEWHPVRPRPAFIHPDQAQQEKARQDYIVIIWRARKG